jgi:glucuronate isomerase
LPHPTDTANLESRLLAEIQKIPILDPHSHINPHAAAAKSLDEILGYHYYTELAHSAGMDKGPLQPSVSGLERAFAIAQYLPAMANTEQVRWLLEIARTFFGFTGEAIDGSNIESLFREAGRIASQPNWADQVWQRSGLERVFLTNDFDDPLDGFDTERFVPCLRTDDLVFRLGEQATIERLRRASSCDVSDQRSLSAAIGKLFEHFTSRGAKACAISLPPDFEPSDVVSAEIDSTLRLVLSGRSVLGDDMRGVERFVFWTLASHCAEFQLPFDLMIGVNRRVYRNGVFQGQDLFDQRTSLYQYRELFNAFPGVTFPISVLTSNQNQELVSYAWIFPNVLPHGHWWYSNIPAYIAPDLTARLTALPATKQIGYYSDAYKLEFVLPKFNMYRRVLASVLAREFVAARRGSETGAIELARRVLYDNPKRVFGV